MIKQLFVSLSLTTLLSIFAYSQEPHYTKKYLKQAKDSTIFICLDKLPKSYTRALIIANVSIYDVDNDNQIPVMINGPRLLCIEGPLKNGEKSGTFTTYVFDSTNMPLKKYKIWEQEYKNDHLNGEWKTFNLSGARIQSVIFVNDTLDGPSREYSLDGKTMLSETIYRSGKDSYIQKTYYKNGVTQGEINVLHGKSNGICKRFYENGNLMEVTNMKNDEFDGNRKYYHDNGQLWIEQVYKNGKPWDVIANYTSTGERRNPGTLHNGSGTVIFYNDDDTIREIAEYFDGERVK